jgi:hypothetical protein
LGLHVLNDAKLLATSGDDDGARRATVSTMVVVARRMRWQRRAIARPELAVSAGLREEIRQHGRVFAVSIGCGERGGAGVYIGEGWRGLGVRVVDDRAVTPSAGKRMTSGPRLSVAERRGLVPFWARCP